MALEKTQLEFEFIADNSKVKGAIREEEKSAKTSTKRTNEDRIRQRKRQLIESIRQVKTNAVVEERIFKKQFRQRLISERDLARKVAAIRKKSAQEISRIQGIDGGRAARPGGLLGFVAKAGGIAAIGFAAKQIASIGTAALQTTANLELFDRRARIVFGDSLPKVSAAAKESAAAIGLTTTEFTAAASAAGDLLKPIGFTASQAADSSIEFLNLAGALKEFNADQRSVNEISGILTKSLLGERDALTSFGIKISEAEIQTRLAEKGQKKLTGQALQLAKATATQTLLFEKSTDALKSFNEDGFKPLSRTINETNARFGEVGETLSKVIGEALTPLLGVISEATLGLVEFLQSLDGSGKQIVVFTGLVVGLGLALAVAFGPIGLIVSGVALVIGGLAIAVDQLTDSNESLNKTLDKENKSFLRLFKSVDDLRKVKNKTFEQTIKLANAEKLLRKEADLLNISLEDQHGQLIKIAEAERLLIERRKKALQAQITAKTARLQARELAAQIRGPKGIIKPLEAGLLRRVRGAERRIQELLRASDVKGALALQRRLDASIEGSIIRKRRELAALRKEFAALGRAAEVSVGARIPGAPKAPKTERAKVAQAERFETIATFKFRAEQIQNNLNLELAAIEAKKEADIAAAKGSSKEINDIKKKASAQSLEAELSATKQQRSEIEKAIAQVTTPGGLAGLAGGFITKATGLAGLGGLVASIPAIGAAISGVISLFDGLFEGVSDKTQDLLNQEELRKEQIKITTALIQQELKFQKELIALQSQRDRLLGTEASRQIALNNILIADDTKRAQANLQVIRDLETEQRTAFGLQEVGAAQIAAKITDAEKAAVANRIATTIIRAAADSIAVNQLDTQLGSGLSTVQLAQFTASINSVLGDENVSPEVKGFASATLSKLQLAEKLARVTGKIITGRGGARFDISGLEEFFPQENLNVTFERALSNVIGIKSEVGTFAKQSEVFLAEQSRLLEGGIELFALLGRIATEERALSGGGAFELKQAREVSFVNIGRGGVKGVGGVFRAPTVQPQALDLPTGAASVSLATRAVKSFSERQAESLENVVAILSDQLGVLIGIEQNTRSGGASAFGAAEQDILIADILDKIADRNIAA